MVVAVVDGEGRSIRTPVGDQRTNDCLREPLLQEGTAAITEEEIINHDSSTTTRTNNSNSNTVYAYHSRNIPTTLWFQGLRCAGEAIWHSSVLSAYVYLLRPHNKVRRLLFCFALFWMG